MMVSRMPLFRRHSPPAARQTRKLRMMFLPTPMGLANAAGLAKADDLTDDNDPTNAAFRQYSKYSTPRRRS